MDPLLCLTAWAIRRPRRTIVCCLASVLALSSSVAALDQESRWSPVRRESGRLIYPTESRDAEGAALASILSAPDFGTVKKVILDGVWTSVTDNAVTLANLRMLSDETDLDDYVSVRLILDAASLELKPLSALVEKDLGVYEAEDGLFSKDVPADVILVAPGGKQLGPDDEHKVTAASQDEYTMDLKAGTVLALRINRPNDDFVLSITGPNDEVVFRELYESGSSWCTWGIPVLSTGAHRVHFLPQARASVTLRFGFTNQNRKKLATLTTGKRLSTILSGWGRQYAKYRLQLKAGDLVEIPDPSSSYIDFALVDSNGGLIKYVLHGEMYHRVDNPGSYYLFVIKTDAWEKRSYTGTARIEPDPDSGKYPVLNTVANQKARVGAPYSLQLAATNEPSGFDAQGLPDGLSIDKTEGLISGTPTMAGTFAIAVFASNQYGGNRRDFLLTVRE